MKLTPEGLVVTEIAPGVELQSNILDQADIPLIVSPSLKKMDHRLFEPSPMGLNLAA
jgi:acyl CoA:acetate/3-ketoacid CoA transferase